MGSIVSKIEELIEDGKFIEYPRTKYPLPNYFDCLDGIAETSGQRPTESHTPGKTDRTIAGKGKSKTQ